VFLNNRYHDPTTGVFISVDPLIGKTGQPYLYANGNPATLSDPSGLDPGWAHDNDPCNDGGYYECATPKAGPNAGLPVIVGPGRRQCAEKPSAAGCTVALTDPNGNSGELEAPPGPPMITSCHNLGIPGSEPVICFGPLPEAPDPSSCSDLLGGSSVASIFASGAGGIERITSTCSAGELASSGFNWSSDGCSDHGVVTGFAGPGNSESACLRHDFGYRNWSGISDDKDEAKAIVDGQFYNDLLDGCQGWYVFCPVAAWSAYKGVVLWGNPSEDEESGV